MKYFFVDPFRGFFHRRLWLAAAGCVLLAACSSIKFGYNHADTVLVLALNRYLDFDDEQEQLAKERIRILLAWHRSTQLSDYSALLAEADAKITGPITPDEVLAFHRKLIDRLAMLGERAAPEVARLALTLRPEQIARLQAKLADDDAKFRRDSVSAGAGGIAEVRAERFLKRTRFWLGSVTEEQQQILRRGFTQLVEENRFWVEEREKRQRELLRELALIRSEQPGLRAVADRVRRYFAELSGPLEQDHAARALRRSNAYLIATVLNAATPDQKAALRKKLRGFAEEFTALAAARAYPRMQREQASAITDLKMIREYSLHCRIPIGSGERT